MKRSCMVGGLAWLLLAAPTLAQQPVPPPPKLSAHQLRDNVYWVEGGTANAGFVIGDDGVIVIDPQRTPAEAVAQIALIRGVTAKPVRTLIVTHGDPDHVGGLPAYPPEVEVIMHENTRAKIVTSANEADKGGPFFGPLYREAVKRLPARTVGLSERRQVHGEALELIAASAHSNGDLMVWFPRKKVVFAGDVVLTKFGPFPIIHLGGSSAGWIDAMRALLALRAGVVVPGHGAIEPRPRLEQRLRGVEDRRARIKAMVEAGKSPAEIDAALPPEVGNPTFPSFNATTYDELTKGYPASRPPWEDVAKPPAAPR